MPPEEKNGPMPVKEREAEVLIDISDSSFAIIEQSEDAYVRESDVFEAYDPEHGEFKFKIQIKYESMWSSDYEDYVNRWCLDSVTFENEIPEEVADWLIEDIFNDDSVEYDIRELSFDEDYEYDELLEEAKVEGKRFTNDTRVLNSIINYLNMGETSIHWKKELKDTGDITCRLFWGFAHHAKCEFENETGYSFLEELECYEGI